MGPWAGKYRTTVCVMNHSSLVKELGEHGAGRASCKAGLVVGGSSESRGALEAEGVLGTVAAPTHTEQHHSVGRTGFPQKFSGTKHLPVHNSYIQKVLKSQCKS